MEITCPICGETIKAIARKCKHCGEWLDSDSSSVEESAYSLGPAEVVEALSGLVQKNLVILNSDSTRYELLESIRQYGSDRLHECGGAAQWRDRHSAYFLEFAEEAEPQLTGADQLEWTNRLEADHDNLRSALSWSSEGGADPETALRICAAAVRFWMVRGHHREGLAASMQSLESAGLVCTSKVRARALNGAGILAACQRDHVSARFMFGEYLAIQRELGEQKGAAAALGNLGLVARDVGDLSESQSLFTECLAICRQLGDQWAIANTLSNLGLVVYEQGDFKSAETLQTESLAIRRKIGDQRGIAYSLSALGMIALEEGNFERSQSQLAEGLAILHGLGDLMGTAESIESWPALRHPRTMRRALPGSGERRARSGLRLDAQCRQPKRSAVNDG